MEKTLKIAVVMMLCVVMIVAVGGCKKKPTAVEPPKQVVDNKPPTDGGVAPTIINPAKDLAYVYFDYDKSSLRPDAVEVLNGDAAKIKNYPADLKVLIEGHCDERGTQEYNLALGERRALAVREYLIKSGIAGDKLFTISFGKEKPAKEGHNEEAWKLNRRAQFNKGK